MPRGFTVPERERIRAQLIDEGERLFGLYGLKKTRVEELAAAAHISTGAFYQFFDSKEELFLTVVEKFEAQVRETLLASIPAPGLTPRARLFALLKVGISMLQTPSLTVFLGSADVVLAWRRLPAERVQSHLVSDTQFIEQVIDHCMASGIPIVVDAEAIRALLYPLVLAILGSAAVPPAVAGNHLDVLLELVAAYCVGEIELSLAAPRAASPTEGGHR